MLITPQLKKGVTTSFGGSRARPALAPGKHSLHICWPLGRIKAAPSQSLFCSLASRAQASAWGFLLPGGWQTSVAWRWQTWGKAWDNTATSWLLGCITAGSSPSLAPSAPTIATLRWVLGPDESCTRVARERHGPDPLTQ